MVAGRLANIKLGDNQHTAEGAHMCAPSSRPVSQAQAAKRLDVSRRSVQSAHVVNSKIANMNQIARTDLGPIGPRC
jgi:hypothetical protein